MYVDAPLMARPRARLGAAPVLPTWEKYATGVNALTPVLTPNAGTAPDGTATAMRIVLQRGDTNVAGAPAGGQNSYSIARITIPGPPTKQAVVDSIYLKLASGPSPTPVGLRLFSPGPTYASNPAANDFTEVRSVCNVTATWQRFSVTGQVFPTGQTFDVLLWTSMPTTALTADILAWYPQSELGSSPSGPAIGGSALDGITPIQWAVGLSLLALAFSGKSISLGGR